MSATNSLFYISDLQNARYVSGFQTFFGLERLPETGGVKCRNSDPSPAPPKMTPHRVHNYFWFYLFSLGTKLGYELFYAFSYSYMFWNIDSLMCRRLIFVWSIIMYTGQALKDILRLPRPHRDHVIVLEPEYSLEFGMPSTHAILALSMPATLFYSMCGRYQFSTPLFVIGALCWISLICCSRLYLGMHSLLDIIAGLSLTCLFLTVLLPSLDTIDYFILTTTYSPVLVVSIVITLALIYPHPNIDSPTRGDTCVMIGSSAGFLLGSWLNYQLGYVHYIPQHYPLPMTLPSSGGELAILLLRTTIGLVIVAIARTVGKKVAHIVTKVLSGVNPSDPSSRYKTIVEVPTKLFTYICVGLAISFFAPVVFRQLNIVRGSMATEAY